jgi:transcriptional regulator with XRE-family HTH domain
MELRTKEICKKQGLTIAELAEVVGITRANMSNIVNNKTTPSLPTLERIASALNVPITELFEQFHNDTIGVVRHKSETYIINSIQDIEDLIMKIKNQ